MEETKSCQLKSTTLAWERLEEVAGERSVWPSLLRPVTWTQISGRRQDETRKESHPSLEMCSRLPAANRVSVEPWSDKIKSIEDSD